MESNLQLQKKLMPDVLEIMQKRYSILRAIRLMQPVGRRSLSLNLQITERVLRSEVEFLKDQNLIVIAPSGMTLTLVGHEVLEKLSDMMRRLAGLDELERNLREKLQLDDVIIVSGNSDESPVVKNELGRAGAYRMKRLLTGNHIIAVTGGATMAALASMLPEESDSEDKNVLFVPARGGLGSKVHNQANTVCENMAAKLHANHRVLYVPDQLSESAYEMLIHEPAIKEVLHLLKSSDIVIHGIGDAVTMAERRKTSSTEMEKIITGKAVGEAFGHYYDENGSVVHKVKTIGLQLNDLSSAKRVMAIAGGSSKAKAISAYLKMVPDHPILITDEGAALELLKG